MYFHCQEMILPGQQHLQSGPKNKVIVTQMSEFATLRGAVGKLAKQS